MSAEIRHQPNLELDRRLHELWPVVRTIVGERLEAAADGRPAMNTTYDRFLWWQVGRPSDGERGEVVRRAVNGAAYLFDDVASLGYSHLGVMAVVRRSSGRPSRDTQRFLVETADLPQRTITEWHVRAITPGPRRQFTGRFEVPSLRLWLSRQPLHMVDDGPADSGPMFELSGDGNSFTDEDGRRHSLAPLQELAETIDYVWPAIEAGRPAVRQETAENIVALLRQQAA